MKYPLNDWHVAGRETICFFFGHKWKHSKSVHSKYYEAEDKDIPYGLQNSTGNAWWEDLAWWSQKCVRCRQKDRPNVWPHNPWYKEQYWAIKDGFHHAWFMFSFAVWPEKEEYFPKKKAVLWKRLVVGTVSYFVGGFGQYWIHFSNNIPFFPAGIALNIEYCFMEWLEKEQEPQ